MKKSEFPSTSNIYIFFWQDVVGALAKIRAHYTFEQYKFKKMFVAMNQVGHQNAQTDKDFYKLMNNANFGYDCRNNADNCYFSLIYDEIDELSIANFIFDQGISDFVSSEILESQIEEEYLNEIANLDPNDAYFEARKSSLEIQKKKEIDLLFSMKKSRQKKTQKNSIKDIDEKQKMRKNILNHWIWYNSLLQHKKFSRKKMT